jgi:hypothetical protein
MLGKWILRLAPYKFNFPNPRGVDNVVTDSFSRTFEGHVATDQEESLLPVLPGFR